MHCRLLNADIGRLSYSLMTVKLIAGSAQVDVIKTVQDHPSVLLHQQIVPDEQVQMLAAALHPHWTTPHTPSSDSSTALTCCDVSICMRIVQHDKVLKLANWHYGQSFQYLSSFCKKQPLHIIMVLPQLML